MPVKNKKPKSKSKSGWDFEKKLQRIFSDGEPTTLPAIPFVSKRFPAALRYMAPENVLTDFTSERERAAIAAVFKWLSLNSAIAWRNKRGNYTTDAGSKIRWSLKNGRLCKRHDAIVMSEEMYERARCLFDEWK